MVEWTLLVDLDLLHARVALDVKDALALREIVVEFLACRRR